MKKNRIILGIAIAYLITLITLLSLAIILTKTNVSEVIINPSVKFVTYFSILTGALISSVNKNKQGWISGIIISLIYIALLYMVSCLCRGNIVPFKNAVIPIILAIFVGALGGIIGVNIKK